MSIIGIIRYAKNSGLRVHHCIGFGKQFLNPAIKKIGGLFESGWIIEGKKLWKKIWKGDFGNFFITPLGDKKRKIIKWQGFCPTHARILPENILSEKEKHPNAVVIVHPECSGGVIELADEVLSTWYPAHDYTISNNIIAEALSNSIGGAGGTGCRPRARVPRSGCALLPCASDRAWWPH